jgi:hypothetical protein
MLRPFVALRIDFAYGKENHVLASSFRGRWNDAYRITRSPRDRHLRAFYECTLELSAAFTPCFLGFILGRSVTGGTPWICFISLLSPHSVA